MEPLISNNYAILKKTFYGASINFTDEGLYVIYIFNGFYKMIKNFVRGFKFSR